MIITLQTSTFGSYGGIPTYNRLFCRALNDFHEGGEKYVILGTDYKTDIEPRKPELPNLQLEAYSCNRVSLVRRVSSLATKHRVDLALIGHVNYSPLGLLLRRLQPKLRYGVIVHGVDVWSRLSPLRRKALREADFIISVSEYTKQRAIEVNGAVADKFHLLPNTLQWDLRESPDTSIGPWVPDGMRLLTVCRLDSSERYKGVDSVIKALPIIIAQVANVQYLIVGTGGDLSRLKELAKKVGVTERVHFLGAVDDASLQAYYKSCDIFVMPSAKEGFGIVFLEAMKYGKPVIAADCGGTPEVVQDGTTGLLVRYGDVHELAEVLTRLCLDPKLRTKYGQAGYERLQKYFSFPKFKQILTSILMQELPLTAIYRAGLRALT